MKSWRLKNRKFTRFEMCSKMLWECCLFFFTTILRTFVVSGSTPHLAYILTTLATFSQHFHNIGFTPKCCGTPPNYFLPWNGPRPKWTIYKQISDKYKKSLSIGNSRILSVVTPAYTSLSRSLEYLPIIRYIILVDGFLIFETVFLGRTATLPKLQANP